MAERFTEHLRQKAGRTLGGAICQFPVPCWQSFSARAESVLGGRVYNVPQALTHGGFGSARESL
jgi:hypothetical protein